MHLFCVPSNAGFSFFFRSYNTQIVILKKKSVFFYFASFQISSQRNYSQAKKKIGESLAPLLHPPSGACASMCNVASQLCGRTSWGSVGDVESQCCTLPYGFTLTQGQLCYLCPSFHVMRANRGNGGNCGTEVIIFSLQPFCHDPEFRSRYSDCVTGWTVRSSNSGKGEEFSSAERPDRHWSLGNLLFIGYGGFSWR